MRDSESFPSRPTAGNRGRLQVLGNVAYGKEKSFHFKEKLMVNTRNSACKPWIIAL